MLNGGASCTKARGAASKSLVALLLPMAVHGCSAGEREARTAAQGKRECKLADDVVLAVPEAAAQLDGHLPEAAAAELARNASIDAQRRETRECGATKRLRALGSMAPLVVLRALAATQRYTR